MSSTILHERTAEYPATGKYRDQGGGWFGTSNLEAAPPAAPRSSGMAGCPAKPRPSRALAVPGARPPPVDGAEEGLARITRAGTPA